MMDRQTKLFLAVFLLIAAILLGVNHLVNRDPIGDWWLAGALAVASLLVWLWSAEGASQSIDETETALTTLPNEDGLPKAQEWIISKDIVEDVPAVVEDAVTEVETVVEETSVIVEDTVAEVETVVEESPIIVEDTVAEVETVVEETPAVVEAVVAEVETVVEETPAVVEDAVTEVETVVEETPAVVEAVVAEVDTVVEEAPAVVEDVPVEAQEVVEAISVVEPAAQAEVPPQNGETGDDLTVIEGIGPKYRDAFLAAGISTFSQLAELGEDRILEIAQAAGMRRAASMVSWAEQAKLAANGEWDTLTELQERLIGGRY